MKWFTVTLNHDSHTAHLNGTLRQKNIPLPPSDQQVPQTWRGGPVREGFFLAVKPADRQIGKRKVHTNTIWYAFSLVMDINSCPKIVVKNFGVKTQISIGVWQGGGGCSCRTHFSSLYWSYDVLLQKWKQLVFKVRHELFIANFVVFLFNRASEFVESVPESVYSFCCYSIFPKMASFIWILSDSG